MKKIILLTDDSYQRTLIGDYLRRKSYDVVTLSSLEDWQSFGEKETDNCIVISQSNWGKYAGASLVNVLRQKSTAPVIIFTHRKDDLRLAIETIKAGAADYLLIPFLPDDLLHSVQKAGETATPEKLYNPVAVKVSNGQEIIGTDPAFLLAIKQAKMVANTNYSVIIYGESGTGKERIAKLIHEKSDRSAMPFIAIDCGALTEELANSELFGHQKGAFTGAVQDKTGCLEAANGGTIFLDEIANLSYSIQVALLRVLQERKIKRIGSSEDQPIDVRIIVASNEKLEEKCQAGIFREDLYYRLNEFYIELPPLRARKQDMALLVDYFIKQANAELNKQINGYTETVLALLRTYDWPGNLRELNNVIKRSCLVANSIIEAQDLPATIVDTDALSSMDTVLEGWPQERAEKELVVNRNKPATLKEILQLQEFELITNTLQEHNNNKAKVARLLKIDRKTLYNKLAFFKQKNFKFSS